MPVQKLKPIIDRPSYANPISEEIKFYFQDLIYRPMLEVLKEDTGLTGVNVDKATPLKTNSQASALTALKNGRLQYVDGCFVGQMNASISKYFSGLGAKFNHVKKGWTLPVDQMPFELKTAVLASSSKSRQVIDRLNKKLDQIRKDAELIRTPIEPAKQVGKIMQGLQEQFKGTTSEAITIQPLLTNPVKHAIETEYTTNLDKFIKEWQNEAIFRLRAQIEDNALDGWRSDRMVERIQAEAGVSRRKAEFLARQETSLLVSKYRQASYEEVGIKEYQWSTSHDIRVRHDHRELNDGIFRFDNPPITDKKTGARNNPGEDYNCRCVAIPIFRESWEKSMPGGPRGRGRPRTADFHFIK